MKGRIQVEAGKILHLVGKGRVCRALESAHPVQLQAVFLPDALDRAQRDASGGRDGTTGPVGDFGRRLGTGECHHLCGSAGGVGWFAERTGLAGSRSPASPTHLEGWLKHDGTPIRSSEMAVGAASQFYGGLGEEVGVEQDQSPHGSAMSELAINSEQAARAGAVTKRSRANFYVLLKPL